MVTADEANPRAWRDVRRIPAALGVLLVALVALSWRVRMVGLDDAWISFRYAKNLVDGHGLVFNPGERVEGYTNFLWTMVMALPIKAGADPLLWAHLLGLAVSCGTVVASYHAACRWIGPGWRAFAVAAAVAFHGSTLAMAMSGMETGSVTLMAALVLLALAPRRPIPERAQDDPTTDTPGASDVEDAGRAPSLGRFAVAGALAGVMLLIRVDSTFYLAPLVFFVALLDRRQPALVVRKLMAFAVPAAVLVLPWVIWKWDYYGQLLPNTAVAKGNADRLAMTGYAALFALAFLLTYGIVLLFPAALRERRRLFGLDTLGALSWTVAVWFAYVIYVGGDWMEFRFFTVLSPAGAVIAVDLLRAIRPARQRLVIGACAVLSLLHLAPGLAIAGLDIGGPPAFAAGETLQEAFPGTIDDPKRPIMAMVGVGIVPYESELRTVDIIGLTDREIALNGDRPKLYVPGHARHATIDQLVERDVNFIFMQSDYEPLAPRTSMRLSELATHHPVVDLERLPRDAFVVDVPFTGDTTFDEDAEVIHLLVLQSTPEIDRRVDSGEWHRVDIERTCRESDITDAVRLLGTRTCGLAL